MEAVHFGLMGFLQQWPVHALGQEVGVSLELAVLAEKGGEMGES